MGVNFSQTRWDKIKEDSTRWWAGELNRPLIQVRLHGADPGRPEPKIPHYGFTAFYDLSIPAEDIVDRWDYDLSCQRYIGDGFPVAMPNFGPGVMASFIGADLETAESTCWFHPKEKKPITELRFEHDPDSPWYKRLVDIYRAAQERWRGEVQVSMTDLGGNLDVLSTFRPSEELLFDLYDHPEPVKARTWEAHEAWWRYYNEFSALAQPQPGYTAWAPIFSVEPYYMLQCDFCYMIGPDMFDEFVRPELVASCKRLTNPFYHLDGVGQLPHLDSLLSIPELKGIQWVPGTGKPDESNWPEVYRKVRDAGKLIQLHGGIPALDALSEQLGTAEGIVIFTGGHISEQAQFEDSLKRYGAI